MFDYRSFLLTISALYPHIVILPQDISVKATHRDTVDVQLVGHDYIKTVTLGSVRE